MARVSCRPSYSVTQADVDAGTVSNTADVDAESPAGDDVKAEDSDTQSIEAKPSVTLDKVFTGHDDANDNDRVDAGETYSWTVTATNTGNVTLTDLTVTDDLTGDDKECSSVKPDGTCVLTARYRVSQADVDAGTVTNTADVDAESPAGDDVTAEDSDTQSIERDADVKLAKTLDSFVDADASGDRSLGDTLVYRFRATNSGNVTLSGVTITDGLAGLTPLSCEPVSPATVAPGSNQTCFAMYVVTQADVDAGATLNVASVAAVGADGTQLERTKGATVDYERLPDIILDKVFTGLSDTNSNGRADAGETLVWMVTATNTGNVTLTDVTLTDDLTGGTNSCESIAPGRRCLLETSLTLTQEVIDAGTVTNTADVVGSPPAGDDVTAEDTDTQSIEAEPSVAIDKVFTGLSDTNSNGRADAGETLVWMVTATNTGNVTLTDVTLTDDLTGGTNSCESIAPGRRCLLETSLTLTQEVIDAGTVTNTADVVGSPPAGDDVTAEDTDTQSIEAKPSVTLDKVFTGHDDANDNDRVDAGETYSWTVTATNTGNVTLSDVTVTDDLTGDDNECSSVVPGGTCELSTDYSVTQADVDAGTVSNTADVVGSPPAGDDVTAEDSDTQSIEAKPSVAVDKVFTGHDDENSNGRVDAGETYSWTVTATNTGNTTITGLTVTDDLTGQNVTCEVVAPDATCVLEATYVLVQADVDAGSVANTATVSGQTPTGEISGSDTDLVPIAADPSVAVAKSVTTEASCDGSGDFIALPEGGGDVVWCFTITNPGNVTLTGVAIDDDLLDMSPSGAQPAGLPATLAPGETVVVSAGSFVRNTTVNTVTAIAGAPAVESEPATAVADVDPDTFGVSGFAFFDRNRDGVQDEGEPLLPGVEVVLEPSDEGESSDEVEPAELAFASVTAGPAFEPGDRRSPRAVTTTGPDGRYTFGAVAVGNYVVRSSMSLPGIVQTSDSDGDLDWSVQLSVVDRPVIAYFAAIGQGTLQGKVYRQVDGLPIANAKLACVWDGPDGKAGTADDVTFESVANAEGNYLIDGLPFGGFACTAVDPVTGKVQPFSATINSEVPVVADVVYPSVVFAQTPSTPKTPAISRPSAPRLPSTGASVLVLLVVAVSMLVGGSALATTSRRRRK